MTGPLGEAGWGEGRLGSERFADSGARHPRAARNHGEPRSSPEVGGG